MTSPSDDIIGLYERNAASWDADRRRARPQGEADWIRRFMRLAEPESQLLDLGCGAGEPIVPDLLAGGYSVTGIDSSPSLIALCKQRFPDQNWLAADMRQLDLECRFGGLLAWHSLFHLTPPDQQKMFPVFARLAAPGAPLMFTSGDRRNVSVGNWRGEALYHASLDAGEYEVLLRDNGFGLVEHMVDDARCGGATVWLAQKLPA
ncbi:MAG: class I SAM-dependent methyltransferase [Euryhalocaulis sp.]|uniref:class I SAM-dependent methyltransferase n=1 Tax=Euryhalocaulis sp. TaxID=2744307 RepID=UPI0018414510|nr:class I SAM-dependent methyltransferase [Euryhalocaulis sp.]MBA4802583.1 class I SAM-dependent methyltransferase [Euryhalocaulis sp.]